MSNETPRPCKDRIKAVGNKRQHDDIARNHSLPLSGHWKKRKTGLGVNLLGLQKMSPKNLVQLK
jgi:hypothetical protein